MKTNRRLMVVCALVALGAWASSIVTGCSAATTEPKPKGDGGEGAGAGPATGGGGTGGAGGEVSNLCGQDCSTISTPDCFESVCNEGMHQGPVGACVVVPVEDRVPCDDGQFCTVNDTCINGQCTGGPQNDCGIAPPQCELVTCDEASSACTTAPAANGDTCDPMDLCVVGATCTNGLCTGGTTNGCFFEPVPNECYNSVCNPANGQCVPVIGNDGAACVDLNDLCSDLNTCLAGVCSGGSPKDCSAQTVGCLMGVCDVNDGQCGQVPIPSGNACASITDECNGNQGTCDMNGACIANPLPGINCPSATDECNQGVCDANGVCLANALPGINCASTTDQCNQGICDSGGTCIANIINEGNACNVDNCFAGQTCSSGICQNGSQILTCVDGDLCCPAGCTIATDQDCLTEITMAALNNATAGLIQDGALTGIAAADNMCDTQAATNGIGGVWKAFLCDSTQDVVNIVPAFLQSFPVKNLSGVTLWNTWGNVFTDANWLPGTVVALTSFDGKLVNENQGAMPEWQDADSWHGCLATGLLDTVNNCSDWTSTVGNGRGGELDFGWMITGTTGQETHVCTYTAAIVCVRISN